MKWGAGGLGLVAGPDEIRPSRRLRTGFTNDEIRVW